jgi:hypothetical protein
MPPVPRIDIDITVLWRKTRSAHSRLVDRGLVTSALLHVAIALLLIFGLPWLHRPPVETVETIPVDLVVIGDQTSAPTRDPQARHPQEMPVEAAKPEPHRPEPVSEAPPPTAIPAPPTPDIGPNPDPLADIRPPRKLPPGPDIESPPHSTARLDIERPTAPNPQSETRTGPSDLTITNANAPYGPLATISAKDFLRAQIERHWDFDVSSLGSTDLTVAIHVEIAPNGAVSQVDIVDDPRYSSNPSYRAAADSARRAVLVASPLQIPPGRYDDFKDVTLNLDPRDALR